MSETALQISPLVKILETSGIEKTKGEVVLENFTNFFKQASEWESKVKALVITDVTQTREMKMAREGRLALRDIRLAAEKTKDRLKEDSIREGRFIQSIYNLIEGTIKPLETELLEKEKFVENLEKERVAKLKAERIELLTPYVADVNHYWLEGMSEADFQDLLNGSKLAHEARIEAERKAEEDRIAKEKAEAEERERIWLENERLKAEAEAREKAIQAEREATEKKAAAERAEANRILAEERARAEAERKAEKEAALKAAEEAEAEANRKQAKLDAILKQEREAREKLEAEKKAAAAEAAAEAKAKADAEKKAAKAPDKEKLQSMMSELQKLSLREIELNSDEAKTIWLNTRSLINKTVEYLNQKTSTL